MLLFAVYDIFPQKKLSPDFVISKHIKLNFFLLRILNRMTTVCIYSGVKKNKLWALHHMQ